MSLHDSELETVRSLIKTIVGHPRTGGPASGDQSPRDVGSCIAQVIEGITPYIFQETAEHPSPLSASQRISVLVTVLTLLLRVTTRSADDSALMMALHQIWQASSDVVNGLDALYSPAAPPPLPPSAPQPTMGGNSHPSLAQHSVHNTVHTAVYAQSIPSYPPTAPTNTGSRLPPVPARTALMAPESSRRGPQRRSGGSVHGYQPYPLAAVRLRPSLPATIHPTPVEAHQALTSFIPPPATTSLASALAVPPSVATTPAQTETTHEQRVEAAWLKIFEVFTGDIDSLLLVSWVCPRWRAMVRSLRRQHGFITNVSPSQFRHLHWVLALSGNNDVTLDLKFTDDTQLPALYDIAAVMHRVVKLGIRTRGNYRLPDEDVERVLVSNSPRLRSVDLDYGSTKKLPSGIFGGAACKLTSASVSLAQLQPDEIITGLTEVCEQIQTLRIPLPLDADAHQFLCAANIFAWYPSISTLRLDGPFPGAGQSAPSGTSTSADGRGDVLFIDRIDIREQPDSAQATLATLHALGASKSTSVTVRDASQLVGAKLTSQITRPTELAVVEDNDGTRYNVVAGTGRTRICTGKNYTLPLRSLGASITTMTFPLDMDAKLFTAFISLPKSAPKLQFMRFLVRSTGCPPSYKNVLKENFPPWKCLDLEEVHLVARVSYTGDPQPSFRPRIPARQLLDFARRQLNVPHRFRAVMDGVSFSDPLCSTAVQSLLEAVDLEWR
ncbi:hypothetical protein EXIGLDRAFT_775537 [Exidia glandulosa HHB12029]|uniref:F-box domain-containing protein n=1 Tax=Exidia glandulosa HHB12029 TaxID=1314781 RepID=A0A165DVW5_EXIGL|nr:hypothetical protein EXIGLDRAFT_775537 [Exidia glandulosa HHB12029]